MSKTTLVIAVDEIPAAYVAVLTAVAASPQTAHRDRVSGIGMTDVAFGRAFRPRGIPL